MSSPNHMRQHKLPTIFKHFRQFTLSQTRRKHARCIVASAFPAHSKPPNFSTYRIPVRPQSSATTVYSQFRAFNPGARLFSQLSNPPYPAAKDQTQFSTPHQSSTNPWALALVIGLFSGAVLYAVSPAKNSLREQEAKFEDSSDRFEEYIPGKRNKMTGESLPGRPGNLTAEEEVKLKELWVATLEIFGVLDKDAVDEAEPAPGVARVDSKKPKKKRLGMFRSKDKGEDGKPEKKKKGSEEEDKYGQGKQAQDVLASVPPETLRSSFWSMVKHDHPDALLLRFLRARKWDVDKALSMFLSTMRWRLDFHVDDDIMKHGDLGALEDSKNENDAAKQKLSTDFLTQLRLGKSFLHGTDKQGRPMCFVRVRLHRQGEQSEESLERYTVYIIESARMILAPPVDTACVVFDMTGFTLANMDNAPVKFMIQCFEANYPESLGVVLIHKAPWVFQGIWKLIRGWLDPVVAGKVHFTNDQKQMEEFVASSHIIKELEGDENWEYAYNEPITGENDKMKDTATRDKLLEHRKTIVDEFEAATLEWVHDADNEALKTKRNEIANRLREDYWNLDPYLRARSHYDRTGLINPGGKLQFYPEKPAEPTPEAAAAPVTTSADDLD